jgi:6-phosphogluconolactonase (cycloisomerase 2 family)
VLVTTKGNTSAVQVFDVSPLIGLSLRPTITSLPGAVPFGVTFGSHGELAVAEAGTNAIATFGIDRRGSLNAIGSAPTGQAATCWIVTVNGRYYLSNAGSGTISAFDGNLHPQGNTATDGGTVDATASADGRSLYVQTGAAGIVDAFRINGNGSLTLVGKVTVPNAVGGEGIAAS